MITPFLTNFRPRNPPLATSRTVELAPATAANVDRHGEWGVGPHCKSALVQAHLAASFTDWLSDPVHYSYIDDRSARRRERHRKTHRACDWPGHGGGGEHRGSSDGGGQDSHGKSQQRGEFGDGHGSAGG